MHTATRRQEAVTFHSLAQATKNNNNTTFQLQKKEIKRRGQITLQKWVFPFFHVLRETRWLVSSRLKSSRANRFVRYLGIVRDRTQQLADHHRLPCDEVPIFGDISNVVCQLHPGIQ